MWVVFEGLDKTGKTTLEWEFMKATNFKHVVVDRGPVGYMVFDMLLERGTEEGYKEFIKQSESMMKCGSGFMVVYCKASESVVNDRLERHNEKQLECNATYEFMSNLYYNNVKLYYSGQKSIIIDTGINSIDQCIALILGKLKEVQRYEHNQR